MSTKRIEIKDSHSGWEYHREKVDEMVLALMHLTTFQDGKDLPSRAWKGHCWNALNRLHEKGFISNPATQAKSVMLTEEGQRKSRELFEMFFNLAK